MKRVASLGKGKSRLCREYDRRRVGYVVSNQRIARGSEPSATQDTAEDAKGNRSACPDIPTRASGHQRDEDPEES